MKRIATIATTLTLLASLTAAIGLQPADAQFNWKQLPMSLSDVSGRRVQLDRKLVDAVATGRLTPAQAEVFKGQLERVARTEAEFRASDGSLSMWESLKLTLDIDGVSKALEAQMQDRQVAIRDIDGRQSEIDKLVTDAVTSGRLTAYEAEEFKRESARIGGQEADLRASDGQLTYEEALTLSLGLDKLQQRIEAKLGVRRFAMPDIDARQAEIDRRHSEGTASGRLTAEESRQLKAEFNRIAQQEASFRQSENRLGFEEALQVALDLEKLGHAVETEMNDTELAWSGLSTKKAEISRKIADGIATGRLTAQGADELKFDCDRITRIEAAFKADGALGAEESLTLATDLDRLSRNVERQLSDRRAQWSGIDARQEDLDRRMATGLATGRLTVQEARDLRGEFDRINQKKLDLRASEGTLTFEESLALALDLDRLSSQLEGRLHESRVAWSGIDARQIELNKQLAESVATGRLTPHEARQLRQQFVRIAEAEDKFRTSDGVLTYEESLMLALDLDRLSATLDRQLRDAHVAWPGVDQQQAILETRISEGISSGKLTGREAADIKRDLERIKSVKQAFASSGGGLDIEETLALAADLELLWSQLDQQLRDKQVAAAPNVRVRQIELLNSVLDGVISERLVPRDVSELKKDFDRIAGLETTLRADTRLTQDEQASLNRELDSLAARIDQRKAAAGVDSIDTRQADFERELNRAIVSRRISPRLAGALRFELGQFGRLKAEYKASGGLNRHEAATLAHQLSSLNSRLQLYISER